MRVRRRKPTAEFAPNARGTIPRMMPNDRLIRIAGAGPSGLAAAIALARAGREVEVHEAKRDVGTRFIGDLQIIEGASESEPVPDFLDRSASSATSISAPANWATFYDHRDKGRVIRSDKPYGWFIHRGAEEGTLDRGLLAQAQAAGAKVIFNSRLSPTGRHRRHRPASPDGLAKEMTWRVGKKTEVGLSSPTPLQTVGLESPTHAPVPRAHRRLLQSQARSRRLLVSLHPRRRGHVRLRDRRRLQAIDSTTSITRSPRRSGCTISRFRPMRAPATRT